MQYYVLFNNTEECFLLSMHAPINDSLFTSHKRIEISQDIYDKLLTGLSNNKKIYLDKNKNPQLCDKFAIYDETSQEWVIDDKLVQEHKILQFKSQAQQALNNTTEYESESYKELCSDEVNAANLAYRIELRKIMKDMYNGTELPKNPNNIKKD